MTAVIRWDPVPDVSLRIDTQTVRAVTIWADEDSRSIAYDVEKAETVMLLWRGIEVAMTITTRSGSAMTTRFVDRPGLPLWHELVAIFE